MLGYQLSRGDPALLYVVMEVTGFCLTFTSLFCSTLQVQEELKTSVETLGTVVKALKLTGISAMTQAALVTGKLTLISSHFLVSSVISSPRTSRYAVIFSTGCVSFGSVLRGCMSKQ